MWKKFILIFFSILIVGCSNDVSVKKKGESKTYLFFKNFNTNQYYVSFWDRNSSINDDTKIIMARDGDNYYYELDGFERSAIIQKDGFRYSINYDRSAYSKEEKALEDFSLGILPKDVNELKTKKYETGKYKVFNRWYTFESYNFDYGTTTYYYKGNDLIYIRYESIQNEILLKYNEMKKKFDYSIFDIPKNLDEISY